MSHPTDWSPSYTAWKLMETILEGQGLTASQIGKELLLDLYSDCVNSVSGEYVADLDSLDDELDDDIYEEVIIDDEGDDED